MSEPTTSCAERVNYNFLKPAAHTAFRRIFIFLSTCEQAEGKCTAQSSITSLSVKFSSQTSTATAYYSALREPGASGLLLFDMFAALHKSSYSL